MNNRFNPQLYEHQLSPFGKNVLKIILSQRHFKDFYNSRQLNAAQQYKHNFPRYNESFPSNSSTEGLRTINLVGNETILSPDSHLNYDNRRYNNTTGDFANVPKSDELVCTRSNLVKSNVLNESFHLQPLVETSKNIEKISDLILKPTEIHDDTTKYSPVKVDNGTKNVDNIAWDNMFDSDLFPDDNNQDLNTNNPIFQITFSDDSANTVNESSNNNKAIKSTKLKQNKKEKANNSEKSNLKRVNTIITDIIPKKTKKPKTVTSNETKSTLRKQNYTKTVSNWLDSNVSEKELEVGDLNESSINKIETLGKKDTESTQISKIELIPAQDSNKKVVQARLTNKGGIMKYDKPKPSTSNAIVSKITEQSVSEEDMKSKTVKEKKSKPKFIAPIKSQLPIENIVYKIDILEDSNIEKHKLGHLQFDNKEILTVLVFSNGFNQLNNHYTDDDCVPEGIMLHFDEYFCYLKSSSAYFRDHMKSLITKQCLVCYGGKKLLMFLKSYDFDIYDLTIQDTKVGGGLIDPDNPPENFSELQKLLSFTPQFTIETECSLQKAAWYITLLKENAQRLKCLLKENSLWKIFVEIEMKILPIIANMQLMGILVDVEKLKSMETILMNRMKAIEQECYKAAGKKFQINSTVQVRSILYDELQLDTKSNVKIKETLMQGAKSTSETMLRSLTSEHPLPRFILEYRRLHKAHATFLSGIAQHVKDGVIKPTWEQTAAATGRIAANNPNIQAIPKALFSLDEEINDDSSLNFRAVYIARLGYVFIAADFQHVECRVFAEAAADDTLKAALKSGQDLFRVLAAKWLKKAEQDISSEDRERTKRIIYASLYGAGARKLMDILNVGYDEALAVLTSFNRTFPSLKSFGRSVVTRCEQNNNKLSTICGRVRHFQNICSTNTALKSHAERQAINFVVQGSAADICKMAMALTDENIRLARPAIEARLLLQIHDELVWEVKEEHMHRAATIIQQSMQSCGEHCGLSVALPVTIKSGRSWGEVQTIQ